MIDSQPTFSGFDVRAIPSQVQAFRYLRDFPYHKGTPELLLSGSVGSAKSIFMAWFLIYYLHKNPGARVCLARRSMPDLKRTILNEVLEMLSEDFIEGEDYVHNKTNASIYFPKIRSEIISISWADGRYNKGKSLKLSGLIFEELTENDDKDKKAFDILKTRVRRLANIQQNFIIAATNPEGPSHWVYKYFIEPKDHDTRKVIYSRTEENPFLDPVYIQQLKKDLDPREARRLLYGEWVEINRERVYHSYSEKNFRHTETFDPRPDLPISICFDFNIGEGKPMSSALYQKVDDSFHIFAANIVEGSRTLDVMEEWFERGVFNIKTPLWLIKGDRGGNDNSTKTTMSDYDIIKKFLANKNIPFRMEVPPSNPPIKTRHNRVNAYFLNDLGESRMFVYKGCEKVDEGFRLTALKSGGQYIEDDSKDYQHVTTAIGYGVVYDTNSSGTKKYTSQRMR